MIRVYQEQDDDCFRAAVASIMEIPLIHVPDLHGVKDWQAEFTMWVMHCGYRCEFSTGPRVFPGVYIAVGTALSRASRTHAVLHERFRMVHDPHPKGEGFGQWLYSIALTPRSS